MMNIRRKATKKDIPMVIKYKKIFTIIKHPHCIMNEIYFFTYQISQGFKILWYPATEFGKKKHVHHCFESVDFKTFLQYNLAISINLKGTYF